MGNDGMGIRYGVISIHEVTQAWCDSSEGQYGDQSCPSCGGPVHEARKDFDYTAECGVYSCQNGHAFYPMEVEMNEKGEYNCPECDDTLFLYHDWTRHNDKGSDDLICSDCRTVYDEQDLNDMNSEPECFTYDAEGYQAQHSASGLFGGYGGTSMRLMYRIIVAYIVTMGIWVLIMHLI